MINEEIWFKPKDTTLYTEELEHGLYAFYFDEKECFFFGFGNREEFELWMMKKGMERVWPANKEN